MQTRSQKMASQSNSSINTTNNQTAINTSNNQSATSQYVPGLTLINSPELSSLSESAKKQL
jgi:hypothetical protein